MSQLNIEISPYKLPETVPEVRSSLMASKVLKLYGILQPFYDFDVDIDIQRTLWSHGRKEMLVASEPGVDHKDAVTGFVAYDVDKDYRSMTIHHLVVEESARRNGVGKALLSRTESEAEQMGLWSVNLRSTDSAIGFYAARGYQLVDPDENMFQIRLPK